MAHKLLYIIPVTAFVVVAAWASPKPVAADDCDCMKVSATSTQTNTGGQTSVDLNSFFQYSDVFSGVNADSIMGFMNQLKNNLNNKSGDDFDRAYIEAMMAVHQMHNDVTQIGISRSNHPELRDLSQKMINESQNEMQQMQQMYMDWFNRPPQQ